MIKLCRAVLLLIATSQWTGSNTFASTLPLTIILHGRSAAKFSMSAAMITHTSSKIMTVKVSASHLTPPQSFAGASHRHTFTAWIFTTSPHSRPSAIPLRSLGMSMYQASGSLLSATIKRILVTVDTSASQSSPSIPLIVVLDSNK